MSKHPQKGNVMEERVVVVDDDAIILRNANTVLTEAGFKVTCLKSGKLLLDYVTKNSIDMLLLDIKMPELDGFETMKLLRKWEMENDKNQTPVIFFTANDDCESETRGLSLGAIDFIRKPFVAEVLTLRVRHLLELIRLQRDLHAEVVRKTKEIEGLSLHVVHTLADAIDAKDAYTKGHSGRVAEYSREIAKRAGYSADKQEEIYMMGLLHDVGKIGVPDAVINKPGKLTDEEYEKIKTHPGRGAKILENIEEMPQLAVGARWHHERYDGRGYPDGLAGENIPEEARIIAVADAYDAMTSNRSYRGLIPQDVVKSEFEKGTGTQFDPRFAAIMLEIIKEDVDYKLHEQ
jgi:putative two-component system response regulator